MNDSLISQLSADYLAALRLHDADSQDSQLQAARDLGVTAVEMGLGTLELAKLHDAALTTILSAPASTAGDDATTTRAASFFYEALTPIEKSHRSALEALKLQEINTELEQRTRDLATSQCEVKREKGERKSSEKALRTSEESAGELLEESRLLEEALREITCKTLSANEAERVQMSLRLQDEIAQTMLGIHVKLLALKKIVSISHEDIAEQIAATQHLMAQSVKAISSFASFLDHPHEN